MIQRHAAGPAAATREGRGARSNAAGRFERFTTEALDDGWSAEEDEAFARSREPTEVARDSTRTIIARNNSPDIGFDRSINPYRGCEHGCIYCFARPTHAFLGLSPGRDFEMRLTFKPEAPALLEKELSKRSYRVAPIALGTNTDPYQPVERRLRVTRGILEVLARFHHPFTITTKGAAVTRDLDLLAPAAAVRLTHVYVSVTTLDRALARAMEPRAATPQRRLEAVRRLSQAGVPVGVMVAPIVPGLTDHEMEAILEAAKAAGARNAGYTALRLPLEVRDLFVEWLEAVVPDRARRVMSLVREMHGGMDYDPRWGVRMRGEGPFAELLGQRFAKAKRRLGLEHRMPPLDTTRFSVPRPDDSQLALF